MQHIPLQAVVDGLYPEIFGSQIISISSKSEDNFTLRIPVFEALPFQEKVRLAVTIVKRTSFTGSAIANALDVDKSQISRWKKAAKDTPLNVFFIAFEIQLAMKDNKSFFEVADEVAQRSDKTVVDIFRWQGSYGKESRHALRAAEYLCGLSTDSELIEKLRSFMAKEQKSDEGHWRYEFENRSINIDHTEISEILNRTPHPEWECAVQIFKKHQQQSTVQTEQSTVQTEHRSSGIIVPKVRRKSRHT